MFQGVFSYLFHVKLSGKNTASLCTISPAHRLFTMKRIVRELQELGEEFLKKIDV